MCGAQRVNRRYLWLQTKKSAFSLFWNGRTSDWLQLTKLICVPYVYSHLSFFMGTFGRLWLTKVLRQGQPISHLLLLGNLRCLLCYMPLPFCAHSEGSQNGGCWDTAIKNCSFGNLYPIILWWDGRCQSYRAHEVHALVQSRRSTGICFFLA